MSQFSRFRDLDLAPALATALDNMGFLEPTPIQQQTIPAGLEGRDIMGCAQTGTGKTGAFGIPLIQYLIQNPKKKALILAPTRELADQITRALTAMSIGSRDLRLALIIGGAAMGPQIRTLEQGARILVATPGRLIDLIQQKKVTLSDVGILVLDEVDRMLDMGFAPQLRQIVPHLPKERQCLLFSATFPQEILGLAESYLRDPVRVTIGQVSAAAATVEQRMVEIEQPQKMQLLLSDLAEISGKVIVFARTQHGTERLAKAVRKAGFSADRLHGGRSQPQRVRALENFRKGETQILIATDIAGRGIDIDDIAYVVNYDMPKLAEDYVHRIGRTGRNGRSGVAISYVTGEDAKVMKALQKSKMNGLPELPSHSESKPSGGQRQQQNAQRSEGQGRRGRGRNDRSDNNQASRQENGRRSRGRDDSSRSQKNDRNNGQRNEGRKPNVKAHADDRNDQKTRRPQPSGAGPVIQRVDRQSAEQVAAKGQKNQDENQSTKKSKLARFFGFG